MSKRINFNDVQPNAYDAMDALDKFVEEASIDKLHKEFIKIRASQINQCAFCLNMHTRDALKIGETQQRIFLLNAWRETDLFTAEEKALLALTEEVTLISKNGVSNATYNEAKKFFSDEVIAQIIMSTVLINSWNRIAVSTHTPIED